MWRHVLVPTLTKHVLLRRDHPTVPSLDMPGTDVSPQARLTLGPAKSVVHRLDVLESKQPPPPRLFELNRPDVWGIGLRRNEEWQTENADLFDRVVFSLLTDRRWNLTCHHDWSLRVFFPATKHRDDLFHRRMRDHNKVLFFLLAFDGRSFYFIQNSMVHILENTVEDRNKLSAVWSLLFSFSITLTDSMSVRKIRYSFQRAE